FQIERAKLEARAEFDDLDGNTRGPALLGELCLQQERGEGRRIDLHLQARPQIGKGAEMILMRMGQQDADQIFAFGLDESRVGKYEVDAGMAVRRRKAHAAIDDDPFAPAGRPKSVKAEIHAYFANPSEGKEDQFRCRCHYEYRTMKTLYSVAATDATAPK